MQTFDPAAFDDFERTSWGRAAGSYVDGFARLSSQTVAPLLDAVGAGSGKRLLDVGCGPGVLSSAALARGCAVTGIDVAEQMLAIARVAVPEATFAQADVQAGLPYTEGSFDIVAGNMLIHHLSRPSVALGHLVRVLTPGGRLGMTMWDPHSENQAVGIFSEAVALAGAEPPAAIPVAPQRLDDQGFAETFAAAGLSDVAVTHRRFEFVTDPSQWWHAVVSSTALTAAIVVAQPDGVQDRIRAAYDRLVQRYLDDSGVARFPASATLAVGTR